MLQPELDRMSEAQHRWDVFLFLVIPHLIWNPGISHGSQRNQPKPVSTPCLCQAKPRHHELWPWLLREVMWVECPRGISLGITPWTDSEEEE